MSTIAAMKTALTNSESLMREGAISEYLPYYEELTFKFHAGLTVQVAAHPNNKVQATISKCYYLTECSPNELVDYLENLD